MEDDIPLINQIPGRQTGHDSLAKQREKQAISDAVKSKQAEIDRDQKSVEQKTGRMQDLMQQNRSVFPLQSFQHSTRDASRRQEGIFVDVEVSGCLNGFPATGIAAYYVQPIQIQTE